MTLFLYVFDTLADWEIGYLTAEIHSRRYFPAASAACPIVKVGATLDPIVTMGGLSIAPDIALRDARLTRNDMLLLPGGNTWMESRHDEVLELASGRIREDSPVAAICGATFGLARVGALDAKKHTSNDLDYLRHVAPNYRGELNYLAQPAVSDRNLVTASGLSAIEFTYEVLKTLGLFRADTLEAWKNLNLTKDSRYFFGLMKSLAPESTGGSPS